jgi:signal transduction histidine kinase
VELEIPPALAAGKLHCDAGLLERALLNIVRNGLEASQGEEAVHLGIVCTERRLIFTVRDSGPGVAEEERLRIFEPFYSTKAKGTGLGLAIAKDIVRAHGGTLSLVNRESGGACFTVSLPVGERRRVDLGDRRQNSGGRRENEWLQEATIPAVPNSDS